MKPIDGAPICKCCEEIKHDKVLELPRVYCYYFYKCIVTDANGQDRCTEVDALRCPYFKGDM